MFTKEEIEFIANVINNANLSGLNNYKMALVVISKLENELTKLAPTPKVEEKKSKKDK